MANQAKIPLLQRKRRAQSPTANEERRRASLASAAELRAANARAAVAERKLIVANEAVSVLLADADADRALVANAAAGAHTARHKLARAWKRIADLQAEHGIAPDSLEAKLIAAIRAGNVEGVILALRTLFFRGSGHYPDVHVSRVGDAQAQVPAAPAPATNSGGMTGPIDTVTIAAGQVILRVDKLSITAPQPLVTRRIDFQRDGAGGISSATVTDEGGEQALVPPAP